MTFEECLARKMSKRELELAVKNPVYRESYQTKFKEELEARVLLQLAVEEQMHQERSREEENKK